MYADLNRQQHFFVVNAWSRSWQGVSISDTTAFLEPVPITIVLSVWWNEFLEKRLNDHA